MNSSRQSPTDGERHSLDLIGSESEAINIVTLPPVDGGFRAWSYVVSAFAMFVVVWGKSILSIGTFESRNTRKQLADLYFLF